jgi:tRNA threonylcarbamoyladenosine biosynthesis protein TsaE
MHATNHITRLLADEAETLALGASLSGILKPGLTLFLHGDLGAGKTTLARGLLQGTGLSGRVKSPTYTLVEPYVNSGINFYHFDLYRFNDPEEWEESGFREYFNADSICLVEWPEKAEELLPKPDLDIFLSVHNLGKITGRKAMIVANTQLGNTCLQQLPE